MIVQIFFLNSNSKNRIRRKEKANQTPPTPNTEIMLSLPVLQREETFQRKAQNLKGTQNINFEAIRKSYFLFTKNQKYVYSG